MSEGRFEKRSQSSSEYLLGRNKRLRVLHILPQAIDFAKPSEPTPDEVFLQNLNGESLGREINERRLMRNLCAGISAFGTVVMLGAVLASIYETPEYSNTATRILEYTSAGGGFLLTMGGMYKTMALEEKLATARKVLSSQSFQNPSSTLQTA